MQCLCHTAAPMLQDISGFILPLHNAYAVTDMMLCLPVVYGPVLSRDHVVFGAAFTTTVDHQW